MIKILWLLLHLVLIAVNLSSCSNKKDYYTNLEMVTMATQVEPSFKLVLPDRENRPISCNDYGKGCMYGLIAEMKGMKLILIHYKSEQEAFEGAKRLNALYFHDWLFDDVRDEPIIEDLIVKIFQAKRAIPATPPPTPRSESD